MVMKAKNIHPEWALKHKKPGTELRLMKGRYYLYEVSSKWNKEKKELKKSQVRFLGVSRKTEVLHHQEKRHNHPCKSRKFLLNPQD